MNNDIVCLNGGPYPFCRYGVALAFIPPVDGSPLTAEMSHHPGHFINIDQVFKVARPNDDRLYLFHHPPSTVPTPNTAPNRLIVRGIALDGFKHSDKMAVTVHAVANQHQGHDFIVSPAP